VLSETGSPGGYSLFCLDKWVMSLLAELLTMMKMRGFKFCRILDYGHDSRLSVSGLTKNAQPIAPVIIITPPLKAGRCCTSQIQSRISCILLLLLLKSVFGTGHFISMIPGRAEFSLPVM
jgi:hypothetical protein